MRGIWREKFSSFGGLPVNMVLMVRLSMSSIAAISLGFRCDFLTQGMNDL
jgi:hypothetical protein